MPARPSAKSLLLGVGLCAAAVASFFASAVAPVGADEDVAWPNLVPPLPPPGAHAEPMTNERLGLLLGRKLEKLAGRPGFWKAPAGEFEYFMVTDEKADRMRIMIPIAKIGKDDKDLAFTLLSANFHRALDAKYAINDGVIWSVFVHPLKSLGESDLDNALKQVRTLADNIGTSFSSTDVVFCGGK
jgi:hypothetical protein